MTIPARSGTAEQGFGREQRKVVQRGVHAAWEAAQGRIDPVELLRRQDEDRVEDLVPIRWGRMSASPFAFYRGSAALMASDLAGLPRTDLRVQLCGDAHLANFGLYGSPERSLLFDVNDFDETLPGPFEWDIKRLAASLVLAARENAFDPRAAQDAALAAARSYREHMQIFATMGELDVWYAYVVADDLLDLVATSGVIKGKRVAKAVAQTRAHLDKARGRGSLQAAQKLTEIVDGRRRIIEQPPLIVGLKDAAHAEETRDLFGQYISTLPEDRRVLIERFEILDVASKVVGVGSVGTRCFIVLLAGRDHDDPLFLQVKQANRSVLEPYLGTNSYEHCGQRIVAGQRLTQAASDIFLGWMTGRPAGRHFYWRQLRDMKGSIDSAALRSAGLQLYGELCGWALARGHARSGARRAIAAYLGTSDRFDQAVGAFATAYADQTERDYATLLHAVAAGKVPAERGL